MNTGHCYAMNNAAYTGHQFNPGPISVVVEEYSVATCTATCTLHIPFLKGDSLTGYSVMCTRTED